MTPSPAIVEPGGSCSTSHYKHRLPTRSVGDATSGDLVVELLRKPVGTADPPQLVADISTIGNSALVQFQPESVDHVVDRAGFVYELRACLAGPALDNVVIQHDGLAGGDLTRSPITVHPSAFRETSGLAEAVHRAAEGYVHSIWGASVLVAPLTLPAGAEITRLAATLSNPWDNPFRIELHRKRLNNLVPSEVLAEVSSIGGVPGQCQRLLHRQPTHRDRVALRLDQGEISAPPTRG